MATGKIVNTITYRKPGIQPPVFIAGSYSEPQWQPLEMSSTVDEDGEHVFKAEILADPGSTVQYKFRLGTGDWWALDENVNSVTDDMGNRNNLLEVPNAITPQKPESAVRGHGEESSLLEEPKSRLDRVKLVEAPLRTAASTPEAARTAAEVADSAALLDTDESCPEIRLCEDDVKAVAPDTVVEPVATSDWLDVDPFARKRSERLEDDEWEPPQDRVPLFSHECLEPSDNSSIGGGSQQHSPNEPRPFSVGFDHEPDKFDLDDPTLEEFPSRLEQISELIHEVEAELDEDETAFEGVPPSPVLGVPRRKTNDIVGEFIAGSPAASPALSRSAHRLEVPRASMGSVASDVSSAMSLQSIAEGAEEDDDEGNAAENHVITLLSPVTQPQLPTRPPNSEDDEAVVLGSPESKAADKAVSVNRQNGESTSSVPHPEGLDQPLITKAQQYGASAVVVGDRIAAAVIDQNVSILGGANDGPTEAGSSHTDAGTLTRRRQQEDANSAQRPSTPASVHKMGMNAAKNGRWLRAFFQSILDFIGGFFRRMFSGGKRQT